MVSDKITISDKDNVCDGLEEGLALIGRTAIYCGFDEVEAGNLQTMAREMVSGSAAILDVFKGTLWSETKDSSFCVMLEMKGQFSEEEREELIELTRDNKNTLPKGFFAKLGVLLSDALSSEYYFPFDIAGDAEGAELAWNAAEIAEMMARMEAQAKDDPTDKALREEAKHVLDDLADDIKVSARGDRVLVTVYRALPSKK